MLHILQQLNYLDMSKILSRLTNWITDQGNKNKLWADKAFAKWYFMTEEPGNG